MSDEPRTVPPILPEICRGGTPGDISLLSALVQGMEISPLDLMTIRDLMELGGATGDPALAAGLAVLLAGLSEGSLCVDLDSHPFSDRLSPDHRQAAETLFDTFADNLAAGRYRELISLDGSDYLPLVLDVSTGRRLLYFHKYHVHERRLKARVEQLLSASPDPAMPSGTMVDGWVDAIYSENLAVRVGPERSPVARDACQIEAIRMAATASFTIVSGGPGTGKTSLMVNMLRCLVRTGIPADRIVLGAPTGRAAQRMTEAIQSHLTSVRKPDPKDLELLVLRGSTLHKILGYRNATHDFYHGTTHPLPASVVVIDEVSMVDLVMMDRFLQAIDPAQTRLILLGDKHQLPSVEAGAVFAGMIPETTRPGRFRERYVVLETVFRSGACLAELARSVNRGDFPPAGAVSFDEALALDPDSWALVQSTDSVRLRAHLERWTAQHYLAEDPGSAGSYRQMIGQAGELTAERLLMDTSGQTLLRAIFDRIDRARILTLLRRGIYGCTAINGVISGLLARLLDPGADPEAGVFSGAVIMITRNDYGKGLFNGDVGVVIRDAHGTCRAFFHRSDGYTAFPVDVLPAWEPGFAVTVHKSQGSEFGDVLLVLPDDANHRLLTREIVYTGITRARKRVILYGQPAVLQHALGRKIQRQSGLRWD